MYFHRQETEAVLAIKSSESIVFRKTRSHRGEAKKVFIFVSFCIVETPFIEEASDTVILKSSRRALRDRASFSVRKLATPHLRRHFLGRRLRGNMHLENTGFRIHVLRHVIESADI